MRIHSWHVAASQCAYDVDVDLASYVNLPLEIQSTGTADARVCKRNMLDGKLLQYKKRVGILE
jgi:hypothetical protein